MNTNNNSDGIIAVATDDSAQDQTAANTTPNYFSSSAANTPYRPYQWYLDGYLTPGSNVNGANVDKISTQYTGAGIKIGIIDRGFDLSDADPTGRFDRTLSYDPRDTGASNIAPDSPADVHGTWVAGVI